MERLTNRDKEIPLPNADNALFWARVHEKLARYEDAEEHTYFASKPQTNADRLRAMTDEELATVIAWPYLASPPWCANHTTCPYISEDPTPCDKCALDWLKEEAKDDA